MKHLGDITKINGAEVEPVEVIIGGSPCQDLSVAGKRAGLEGARSGLFMEQIRIIKEMRENDRANGRSDDAIRPRYMVFENVPGLFSSTKGEDFRIVIEETAKIADPEISIPRPPQGKWTNAGAIVGNGFSIAWRVLDAQFFGVPQRRRRIALVADFGGQSAPEILFERESLSRNIEPSGTQRQGTAGDAERSVDKTICYGISAYESNAMKSSNPHSGVYEADTSRTLDNNGGNPGCNQGGMAILYDAYQHHGYRVGETCNTLTAGQNDSCRGDTPLVQSAGFKGGQSSGGIGYVDEQAPTLQATPSALEPTVVCLEGNGSRESHKGNGYRQSDTMYTLNTVEQHAVCYDARGNGNGELAPTITVDHQNRVTDYTALCIGNGQADQTGLHEIAGALNCMHDQQALMTYSNDAYDKWQENEIGATLKQSGGMYQGGSENLCLSTIVRRLTPLECERLQGYPDGWTDIGDWTDTKGKKHKAADSPRYKALGNSIAIPCWRFILQGISERVTEHTMASLFAGIGGFELCSLQVGIKPIWNSEVEEFCIAVTKKHFGNGDEKGDYEQYL